MSKSKKRPYYPRLVNRSQPAERSQPSVVLMKPSQIDKEFSKVDGSIQHKKLTVRQILEKEQEDE